MAASIMTPVTLALRDFFMRSCQICVALSDVAQRAPRIREMFAASKYGGEEEGHCPECNDD
ncbi:MAG: hypothetical protein Q9220_000736 [cf. Caloplaca sp. 1 TL-2023]